MLIISVLSAGFCFGASALVIYDGDFGYEVNTSKREATLVRYSGNGGTGAETVCRRGVSARGCSAMGVPLTVK